MMKFKLPRASNKSFVLSSPTSSSSSIINYQRRYYIASNTKFAEYKQPTTSQPAVFDRSLKQRQKSYYINKSHDKDDIDYYDYLRNEITNQLADRIDDISRTFPLTLEIGSHRGSFLNILNQSIEDRGSDNSLGGIQSLIQTESFHVLQQGSDTDNKVSVHTVICDEESLPFPPESFDIILCPFSIHWINNIPSFLTQVKTILKPDGVFLGAILGGSTLEELRYCFYLAETERKGGIGMHTSPFVLPSDVAGLMQSAGFSLPTVDIDTIQISYPDAFTLMEHVQRMGEGDVALSRPTHVGRDTMLAMAAIYQDKYGLEDGSITATFQVIYVIGWAPHESQPKPCQRGSAVKSFQEIAKPAVKPADTV